MALTDSRETCRQFDLADKPAWSKGFAPHHQVMPRLVQWAIFDDVASNASFYFSTTHYDNNYPFQKAASPLFLNKTAELSKRLPAIVTGDFNSNYDSEAFAILKAGGLEETCDLAESVKVVSNQVLALAAVSHFEDSGT